MPYHDTVDDLAQTHRRFKRGGLRHGKFSEVSEPEWEPVKLNSDEVIRVAAIVRARIKKWRMTRP